MPHEGDRQVKVIDSVLIVEDEGDWCAIYERSAQRQGVSTIRVAKSLVEAELLLDAMSFAVAFVDIGLDARDDRNVDGLRVMERIRALGDETSIIVVTGRSGRDVLDITRDAIRKYGVFEIVGKVPIEPGDIDALLQRGLKEFRSAAINREPRVHEVLQGGLPGWSWDDQVLRATRIAGGVSTLYGFLDNLFAQFLPVVARKDGDHVQVDSATEVAYGEYWSRAMGKGILLCFGDEEHMKRVTEGAAPGGTILSRFHVDEVLDEREAGGVVGTVFALTDAPRQSFHASET
jgi:ActR/RegA family two-component response regulator